MRVRVAVFASGEGTNLQALLDAAKEGRLDAEVVLVVSDHPEAAALARAARAGVTAQCLRRAEGETRSQYERRLVAAVQAARADVVVLAGFMRLLGPTFLRAFPNRIINLHPALLPAFPGLDAQGQALAYGVRYSGCTVHLVDEGMDTGPILLQAVVPVFQDDTRERLAARIRVEEHRLLVAAVQLFATDGFRIEGRRVILREEEPR